MSRRRLVLVGALVCVVAAAWGYLANAGGMATSTPAMPEMRGMDDGWSAGHAGAMFGVWAVMMIAMMLPPAATAIAAHGAPFALGYITVWSAFACGATLLQCVLERAGLLASGMELRSAPLAALVVAAIGIYQLTPLKDACLRRCRSDAAAHPDEARVGRSANVALGIRHGLSCVGCCWALMLLMFVGGVMNVVWMAALTVFVLAERVLPHRIVFARAAGVALILLGAVSHAAASVVR